MLGGGASSAGTSLLYCGEQYDSSLSQYYLRARYYDQSNGRFTQTDPFEGNNDDPQSLHKYTYCHADPVNAIDPSGCYTYMSVLTATTIRAVIEEVYTNIYTGVESAIDAALNDMSAGRAMVMATSMNAAPAVLFASLRVFDEIFEKASGRLLPNVRKLFASDSFRLVGRRLEGAESLMRLILQQCEGRMGTKLVREWISELDAELVAKTKGWTKVKFQKGVHGYDQIWKYMDDIGREIFVIVEAKGGTGELHTGQMSQKWIKDNIKRFGADSSLYWKLTNAIEEGRLRGMVVRTRVEGAGAFVPSFVEKDWRQIGRTTWSGR